MSKSKSATIEVQGTAITVIAKEHGDYISLTDMVRPKGERRTDHPTMAAKQGTRCCFSESGSKSTTWILIPIEFDGN
jgi:hypothetical protein